jgi:DNA-binding LacI/PurR family transcriptional regulator
MLRIRILTHIFESRMRITQQDIARIARVSQATVSRVLAGDQKVEGNIRDRVLKAIAENNYRPDVRARSLRSRRTGLVGLVVKRPEAGVFEDPFYTSLIGGITEYLAGKPYHLCLDVVASDANQTAVYDEMLRSRRVDGVILVEPETRDERIARLQQEGFPFVLIGNPLSAEIHSVDNDNVLAGELATAHLLDRGFQRVGILGGPAGVTFSDDRVVGYQRAVRGRQEEHLIWHTPFGLKSAQAAVDEILNEPSPPDALVVLDDLMAMGAVLAARARQVRIPEELGLVSFNDSTLCDLLEGGLTSVSLNIPLMVSAACDRLLKIIEGRPISTPVRRIVPCELRSRGSSLPVQGVAS